MISYFSWLRWRRIKVKLYKNISRYPDKTEINLKRRWIIILNVSARSSNRHFGSLPHGTTDFFVRNLQDF